MIKISESVWLLAAVLGCAAIYEASSVFASSRAPDNGWTISNSLKLGGRVRFGMGRTEGNSTQSWNSDMPWSSFKGLNAETLSRFNGVHTFEMVRGAGSFVCTGEFSGGRGRGSYTFKANPEYMTKLQSLGYSTPTSEDLFQMTMADVSLDFATALRAVSESATTEDLMELSMHGVKADVMREIKDSGMTHIVLGDYIELQNHGVKPEFLRNLKKAGYDIPANEIVQLRDHGIDARYLESLGRTGLKPNVTDLVEMKNNGVSGEFLAAFHEAGVVDPHEVVEMKNQGLRPEFVTSAKAMGYNFTPKELIEMHHNGVDAGYLRKLKDSGFNALSAEKIVKLRTHGVD